MRYPQLLLIPLLLAAAGCDPVADLTREPVHAVQTDRSVYEVRRLVIREKEGVETEIPMVFTNLLPDTVFLAGCGLPQEPVAEKWIDGAWVTARIPGGPFCGLTFWPVPPGGTHADTLHLIAFYAGQSIGPEFSSAVAEPDHVPGRYRLLRRIYSDRERQPTEITDEAVRLSNEFDLVWAPGEE